MSLEREVHAVRRCSALSLTTGIAAVEVGGAGARDLLNLAAAQSAHKRDGRVRQTLLLRDDGTVFADVLVASVDGGFLILAEGAGEAELVDWLSSLRDRLPAAEVSVRGVGDERAIFSLDGPYSWEVAAGLLGPAVLGMPYLSIGSRDDALCIRAGKTGEYGYLLILPREAAPALQDKLAVIGGPLDLVTVTRDAIDLCALECGHFSMRFLDGLGERLTPLELQLQWRVGYTRDFVGADALRAKRNAGPDERVTYFTAEDPAATGHEVHIAGQRIGRVLIAAPSPTLGRTVGWALLARRFAHPHLDLSAVAPDGSSTALRTCPAFLFQNESLRVQPHLGHTYANRGERP